MTVYITRYTFKKMIVSSFLDAASNMFEDTSFLNLPREADDNLTQVFSKKELHEFFATYLSVLASKNKDYKHSLSGGYTGNLTFKTTPPKYHADIECEWMLKDYQNLIIPVEIEVRGEGEVAKFRKFAEEHKKLFLNDKKKFYNKAMAQFLLKQDLVIVEVNNSGAFNLSLENLNDLISKIERLLTESISMANSNISIKNMRYANRKAIKQYESSKSSVLTEEALAWHKEYKTKLFELIVDKILTDNMREFSFEEGFAREFGLLPCKTCFSGKEEESSSRPSGKLIDFDAISPF